jgi:hypothetical protein
MAPPANIIGLTSGPFVNLAVCPAATNAVTGAGLQTGYQSMMDNAAFMNAVAAYNTTGANANGYANDANAGTFKFGGTVQIISGGTLSMLSGSTLHVIASLDATSVITAAKGAKIAGEIEFPTAGTVDMYARTRIAGSDSLSDSNHQLVMGTTKQSVQLFTNPAAGRTIILPEAAAWAATTGYTATTDYVTNGGNLYQCSQSGTSAGSGGPTGTGTNITDGSCKWDYVSPAPVEGDWFEITCLLGNSAFPIQIQRLSNLGTDVAQLTNSVFSTPGTNNAGGVRVRFNGTNWRGHFAGGCCAYGGDW